MNVYVEWLAGLGISCLWVKMWGWSLPRRMPLPESQQKQGYPDLVRFARQFVVENGFVGLLQAITVHFPFVDLVCGPLKSSTLLSSCDG